MQIIITDSSIKVERPININTELVAIPDDNVGFNIDAKTIKLSQMSLFYLKIFKIFQHVMSSFFFLFSMYLHILMQNVLDFLTPNRHFLVGLSHMFE